MIKKKRKKRKKNMYRAPKQQQLLSPVMMSQTHKLAMNNSHENIQNRTPTSNKKEINI
jgi:hypothetical protein